MKNKLLLPAFICFMLLSCAQAQAFSVRCKSATVQHWSGGIAGRYGANYCFEIEFSDDAQVPLPDSGWVDNEGFALHVRDSATDPGGNMRVRKQGRSTIYTIIWGTSHDENLQSMPQYQEKPAKMPAPGVACFSYTDRGVRKYFSVTKFTQYLQPANYP
jgi:hypothetical protein